MAPIIPFIPLIASGIGAATSLIGGRKDPNVGRSGTGLETLTGPLGKGGLEDIGQARGFFGDILKGGQPLAEATGTTTSDVGRQYKNILSDVNRNAPRGGVATKFTSELPYLQTSDVNRLRLGAKTDAAKILGELGIRETGQAMGGYEGLLRGALVSRAQNRDFYGQIGQDIGGLLGSVFSKKGLPGMVNIGGSSPTAGSIPISDLPGSGLPVNYPDIPPPGAWG